jgi:Uma2 family endonuclease
MSTPGRSRAPMTAADYLAMADDGRRYQLFDGELVEMTPGPSVRHQLILMKLAAWLHGHAEARGDDLGHKADVYAAAGVAHYWIVDPEARSIAEWSLGGARFVERSHAASGGRFRPTLFPGLELDLDTLFRA